LIFDYFAVKFLHTSLKNIFRKKEKKIKIKKKKKKVFLNRNFIKEFQNRIRID